MKITSGCVNFPFEDGLGAVLNFKALPQVIDCVLRSFFSFFS